MRMVERAQALGQGMVSLSRSNETPVGLDEEATTPAAIPLGMLLVLSGLFLGIALLIAAAFGLGAWRGHDAWGFLVVSVALAALGFALSKRQPTAGRVDVSKTVVEETKTTSDAP